MRRATVAIIGVLLFLIGLVCGTLSRPLFPPARAPGMEDNRLAAPLFLSRRFVESLNVPAPPQALVDELAEALTPGRSPTAAELATLIVRCREHLDLHTETSGIEVSYWDFNATFILGWVAPPDDHRVQVRQRRPWVQVAAIRKPKRIGFEDAETNGPD